jgi:hypothetical protein
MKTLTLFIAFSCSAITALAQDSTTTIAIDVYQCLSPNPPNCVSPDEESKTTSCPGCKSWGKTSIASSLQLDTKETYNQPKMFVRDAAKQMYGSTLKTRNGAPVSIAQLYADPEKYGWVEIKDEKVPKEGTIAVLPHTAGVVVKQTSPDDTTVLYSSTKKKGAVIETDIDHLTKANEQPKYVVPRVFLEKAAEKARESHIQ